MKGSLCRSMLAGIGFVFFANQCSAIEIEFDGADIVSVEDERTLRTFIADLQNALPPRAAELIDRPILIQFRDLDGTRELGDLCPSKDGGGKPPILGQTETPLWVRDRYEIKIHKGFLKEIIKGARGSQVIGCLQGTMYKTAIATVLHEIGHILDSSHRFSASKQYRSLTNWYSGKSEASTEKTKNTLMARSPNNYEFKNPAEGFAINFEYFLLDSEFSCRRPAVSRYYAEQFGAASSHADCTPFYKVELGQNNRIVDIDPSRISAVHFLFASQGPALMSRWGHASYHLIICAPGRKDVGPECLQDTSYHVIAGYGANVLDPQINAWKGLAGGYPSRIFFNSFPNIIQAYNQEQLRDLISLPLSLSEKEKTMFVEHLLEDYWGYEGRYAFFSNNCATEANDALSSSIESSHQFHDSSSISPIGLYEDLAKARLIDPSLLEPRHVAIQNGYFYPSRRSDLDIAFTKLKYSLPLDIKFTYDSLDQFRELSSPTERLGYLNAAEPQRTAALYVLEKDISQSLTKRLSRSAVELAEKPGNWPEEFRVSIAAAYANIERLKPWNQTKEGGYGVPRESELQDANKLDEFRVALVTATKTILETIRFAVPDLFEELRASMENLRQFGIALKLKEPAISARETQGVNKTKEVV